MRHTKHQHWSEQDTPSLQLQGTESVAETHPSQRCLWLGCYCVQGLGNRNMLGSFFKKINDKNINSRDSKILSFNIYTQSSNWKSFQYFQENKSRVFYQPSAQLKSGRQWLLTETQFSLRTWPVAHQPHPGIAHTQEYMDSKNWRLFKTQKF